MTHSRHSGSGARDPWPDFSLSSSGSGENSVTGSAKRQQQEIPFYVSQYKTSAEIIEEAKANMTKPGSFPMIR